MVFERLSSEITESLELMIKDTARLLALIMHRTQNATCSNSGWYVTLYTNVSNSKQLRKFCGTMNFQSYSLEERTLGAMYLKIEWLRNVVGGMFLKHENYTINVNW